MTVPQEAPLPGATVGRCYKCGAGVLWTVTAKGHRMPVDPPKADAPNVGTVVISYGPEALRSRTRVGEAALDDGEQATVPHVATCPARRVSLSQARRAARGRLEGGA